ncbi:MAG: RES family NAD+ phosphorylase [Deltaproteobacteria bacterium]|nr:RES family NAD+ phosphorylase [Deltaproteobacteria bacterium]
MIEAWRICQRRLVKRALDGEAAFLYGGRWNSPGTRVVYLASSLALAMLEMLVHVEDGHELLVERYVAVKVELDAALVKVPARLPRRWHNDPPPRSAAQFGDGWVASGSSLALRVPSAIIPSEPNYLLNPSHREMRRLRIGKPLSFSFDSRLAPKV